jgi:hypothetical protein
MHFSTVALCVALFGAGCSWFGDGERPPSSAQVPPAPTTATLLGSDGTDPDRNKPYATITSGDRLWSVSTVSQGPEMNSMVISGPSYTRALGGNGDPRALTFSLDDHFLLYLDSSGDPYGYDSLFLLPLSSPSDAPRQITNVGLFDDAGHQVVAPIPSPREASDITWSPIKFEYTRGSCTYSLEYISATSQVERVCPSQPPPLN